MDPRSVITKKGTKYSLYNPEKIICLKGDPHFMAYLSPYHALFGHMSHCLSDEKLPSVWFLTNKLSYSQRLTTIQVGGGKEMSQSPPIFHPINLKQDLC